MHSSDKYQPGARFRRQPGAFPMLDNVLQTPNTLCLLAIRMMGESGVMPTPHNYEIFYLYNEGRNGELKRAVAAMLGSGKAIPQPDMEEIYAKLVAPKAMSDAISALSDRLSSQIGNAMTLTQRVASSQSSLGGSMSKAADTLRGLTDPAQMQEIIGSVVLAANRAKQDADDTTADLQTTVQQVRKLENDLAEVRRESMTDELTQVGNRRFLDRRLSASVKLAKEKDVNLSLCMIDIDHFKSVNDRYGHGRGDEVLKSVARTINEIVEKKGSVGRFGGEEFAVVLPGADVQDAIALMERIRRALERKSLIIRSDGIEIGPVTASFGIAQFHVDDNATSLLERADQNLYRAKAAGRNRVYAGDDGGSPIAEIASRIRAITSHSRTAA